METGVYSKKKQFQELSIVRFELSWDISIFYFEHLGFQFWVLWINALWKSDGMAFPSSNGRNRSIAAITIIIKTHFFTYLTSKLIPPIFGVLWLKDRFVTKLRCSPWYYCITEEKSIFELMLFGWTHLSMKQSLIFLFYLLEYKE